MFQRARDPEYSSLSTFHPKITRLHGTKLAWPKPSRIPGYKATMLLYPKSQPFSLRYKSILPTSLTYIILRNQRLLTLETCCGFGYGLILEKSRPKPATTLTWFSRNVVNASVIQKPNDSFETWTQTLCKILSGPKTQCSTSFSLGREDISTGHSPQSSQVETWFCNTTFQNSKFRNINLIPFRDRGLIDRLTELTCRSGPTNPCLNAIDKETFSTTVFKA